MMSQNPFSFGQPVPPDRFVGRKAEIETAFDQIFNRSHLAIWGGTGMGKSSFLEQLASPQVWKQQGQDPSNAVIVLLNCADIHPFSASGFWHEVLSLLKDELDSFPTLQTEIENLLEQNKATKDSLQRLLKRLGRQNKFLLLLVDNYDAAFLLNKQYSKADLETFLSECRSLAYYSRTRHYISIVVTSSRSLNELGPQLNPGQSPWYNHYFYQPLKPFTDSEVNKLLENTMTPALQDGIREIADGNPALLQIAGYLLYRERQQTTGRMPDAEAFAREFETATRHIFQAAWELCTELEQTLLMLIALSNLKGRLHGTSYDLSDIDIIFSQNYKELSSLEERGVIICMLQGRKKIYSFTSSIMERRVVQELEQIGSSNELSLQQRKRVFLNLMSSNQAEQIISAMRWLWQHKDDVPSILEWIGKIAAALPRGAIRG